MKFKNIPYSFYSLNFLQAVACCIFFGNIIIGIVISILNQIYSWNVNVTVLSSFFVIGFLIIWFLGNSFIYTTIPKFISPEDYFQNFQLIQNIESPNFKEYINRYASYIKSENKFFLIYALNGYGKSHLLNEIVKFTNKNHENYKILFLKSNKQYKSIEEAFNNEIERKTNYLIIWDGLELNSPDVKKIISFCNDNDLIKVIFTFKPCERNKVVDKIEDNFLEIKLDWPEEDLVILFRSLTNNSAIGDERFVLNYSNPLLISLKLDAAKNPNFDFKKLEKLVMSFDKDIYSCLKEFNYSKEDLEYLILNLACLIPFPINNNELLSLLSTQAGFKTDEIKKMIEKLINSGIFLLFENEIRFKSEIMAYLYIYYKIKDYKSDEIRLLVNKWLEKPSHPFLQNYLPKNIYINFGNSTQIFNMLLENVTSVNIPDIDLLFNDIITKWIEEDEKTYLMLRKLRLESVSYFCHLVPESSLDLLNAYLDSDPPISDEKYFNSELRVDNFAPIILKLINFPSLKKQTIKIIEKMEYGGITGVFGNKKAADLIQSTVSPFKSFNIKSIVENLDILSEFFDKLDNQRISILKSALEEVFKISDHDISSGHFSIQTNELRVVNSPGIILVRDKGLEILKKMINDQLLESKLIAIEISSKLGVWSVEDEKCLSDRLIKERKEIILEIENLIDSNVNFKLLNEIENLFLEWWAKETNGTEKVSDLLKKSKFSRNIEYITSKHFVSNQYVVEDFESFEVQAPAENRWKWFVNKEHEYLIKCDNYSTYKNLVIKLDNEYSDISKLTKLLEKLDLNLADYEFNYNTPLIACWVKHNPDLFISLKGTEKSWLSVPERFKGGIKLALSDMDDKHIKEWASEILGELEDVSLVDLNLFITSLIRSSITKKTVILWLNEILEKGNSDVKWLILRRLRFIFDDDPDKTAKIVLKVISEENNLNKAIISDLWLTLPDKDDELSRIDPITLKKLRKTLFNKLIYFKEIDYKEQKLLKFIFEDMTSCLDFAEARIKNYKSGDFDFNPIPFDGIDYIKDNINSYNDFENFMDHFLLLYIEKEWRKFLNDLIKPLETTLDLDSYYQEYIKKQIKALHIENALFTLEFLSLNEKNCDLFVNVGKMAVSMNKYDEINEIIGDKTAFDSYSCDAGIVPPEFLYKLEMLEKMYDLSVPGKFRNMIKKFIKSREKEIKREKISIEASKYR